MQISQIYLSTQDTELPVLLKQKVESIKQNFSLPHQIYSNEKLRQLIAQNFDVDVLRAYDKLLPFSYKADLGKYCLVYHYGGWYFDISIRSQFGWIPEPEIELVTFRDIQRNSNTCFACTSGIFYAKKGSEILETAIRDVVKNCREEYYGITPLCPTGPTVFGKAIAKYGASQQIVLGDFLPLTPSHSLKNLAFVFPDGRIFAWHKNVDGGDLSALGAQGTNNYNDFWHQHNVYNSQILME